MSFEELSVVAFEAVGKGCKNSKPEGVYIFFLKVKARKRLKRILI